MFKVEVIGTLYINYVKGDLDKPFYSINITQSKRDGEEYFYVNIFFKEGITIPDNGTKIRVTGDGKLFRDKNTKVVRISISNAQIEEIIENEQKITEEDVPLSESKLSTDLFDNKSIDEFAF